MKDKYCIVCDETIRQLRKMKDCYDGGVVGKIQAGYGSSFDLDTFEIAICDKCLRQKMVEGVTYKIKPNKHEHRSKSQ